jgi:PAS domain S-box-containing protein
VISSLDLPELLQAIHQHIGPLMDARNFYVALYDEGYDELIFPLAYEDGQPTRYRSRAMSNGLTEYVLRTRTPLLIPSDVSGAIQRLGLDVVTSEESACWLGVPITIGDRVLGVIAVQSQRQLNLYNAEDVELLSTIASQAAVAIENAQLYASTRRRAAELAILNSVSTAVGSTLNFDQVMDAIVTSVGPVVGCQKAAIFLVEEDGPGLKLSASRGLNKSFLAELPGMMLSARGEGSVSVVNWQPLIVNNLRLDPRFEKFRAAAEREGIRAFADVPLQARDKGIGMLAVYYSEPHRFTVAELDLLTTFANQAAAAVSNATLYAQTDQALSRRVDELATLGEIGRELTSTLDFNRVIERVLDAAIASCGATRGLVALYDADRHALTVVAARGFPSDRPAHVTIQGWLADQDLVNAAIRDRTTIWRGDIYATPGYRALDPAVQSVVVAPILREGEPVGLIDLESDRRAAFNDDTATFVTRLSTQATIAIRNAQLYQQARNRLREMSFLFDMSRQFTSILDLDELGKELSRQLAMALGTTHCQLELVDRDSGETHVIAAYAASGADPIALPRQPSGALRPLSVDDLQRNPQPVVAYVDSMRADDPEYRLLTAHNLQALIALPLVASNQVIGRIIWMHNRPRAPFSADEIRFAQTLANQASIAVENARLFHERARRINDLSHLYQASLALAASIEFDEALNRIALIAREITDSDTVTLYLYDAQTHRITHGSHLAGSDRLQDVSAVRPHGMTWRVIAERRPILVNNTLTEPDVNPLVLEAGLRSSLAMPILRKDQVVGVLHVNSRTPGKYSADSVQLVQLLANEAAVAIENARLFREVAEARDRLAAILDSSRDGVLMFDTSGRVVVANPMLEQLWGIRRTDLEGRSLLDLLERPEFNLPERLGYRPAELRELLDQVRASVVLQWGKGTYTLPGARPRAIERTGLPVLDQHSGLVGWMLVLHDVTEEHELQQMREDLSDMIVHDLRSPLVAILDSYELIAEARPAVALPPMATQAIDVGQRSTRKLLDLVNSLLDISRFEHGQMPLDTQFAALRPLADNALEAVTLTAAERRLIVHNEIPRELPMVKVDEDQIIRVLINLIDNAIKFSQPGDQVTVSARPDTSNGDKPVFIICSVRDMGAGIPPEHRQRIFDRFIQLGDGVERRRGTGLGLAFCKMAIEAHGGLIWVEDPPEGKGSQFCFTLPVAAILPPFS